MEELLSKRGLFTEEVILKKVSIAMIKVITETIPKISQVDLISKSFYDASEESQSFNELNLCQETIVLCDESATCEEIAVLCHVVMGWRPQEPQLMSKQRQGWRKER